MNECTGKWVFITGGSSGIGLALAELFASEGAHIAILARRKEVLDQAVAQISEKRNSKLQQVVSIQADVSDLEHLIPVLQAYEESNGTPEIVINSAGISYPGKFHTLPYETIKSLMDINFLGSAYVTRAFINGMIKRGSGHIVNISSVAGFIGTYGYSAYGASKYAIRGFSDVLRAEYKLRGIKVSVVFPPDTETPQLEFEKDLKPAITKELADTAGVMTAEQVAAIIWKDMKKGRYTIIPGFNSWFLYKLINLLGDLSYPVMDLMVSNAIRSILKRRQNH
jgi:3-dehydrosphinganine reductase